MEEESLQEKTTHKVTSSGGDGGEEADRARMDTGKEKLKTRLTGKELFFRGT